MGSERIDLLLVQMHDAYARLRERLEGLTDHEYLWEPVPGCWTLHRMPDGRWTYDYEVPEPKPSPFTTVGWRIWHIASCKVMYHEHAFGPAELTWLTIQVPGSLPEMMGMLERGQRLLVDDLEALPDDSQLDRPRATNWGELWPTWKIIWTMIWHDAHHGAEIGALRDLYFHAMASARPTQRAAGDA